MKIMSIRTVVSVVTVVFLALILYAARQEIMHAWELLSTVNLWVLSLIVPAQVLVYFVAGEMMFCYLRDKKAIKHIRIWTQARMALEMNFVNHTLPSAGVSGMSYMTWRLGKYGISAGRATVAQLVRFAASFASFIVLLLVALLAITIDGGVNRWIILLSSIVVFAMVAATVLFVYLVSSPSRGRKFSHWITDTGNRALRFMRIRSVVIPQEKVGRFFIEMHDDYLELKKERRLLLKPFLWGILFMCGEVLMFMITFWSLGAFINPAPVLIAYGLASTVGSFVPTPGGAGAYEATMVSFLALAGVVAGTAIAGILLTRIILMFGTIGLGYFFYQHALIKYGKSKSKA